MTSRYKNPLQRPFGLTLLALALAPLCGCGDDTRAASGSQEPVDDTYTLDAPSGSERLEVVTLRPPEILVGQPFDYSIRVRNVSDKPVHGVLVRQDDMSAFEVLGAQLERPNGADEPPTREELDVAGAWQLGSLQADEEVSVEVRGIANETGERAYVLHVEHDTPIRAQWLVVDPELRLTRELDSAQVWVCEEIEVTYSLSNTGTGTTAAVRVTEELPEGLTHDGGRTIEFEVPPIAGGETVEETITLTPTRGGSLKSSARAVAGELTVRSATQTMKVMQPELELSLEIDPAASVAQLGRLRVRVENPGPDPAREVVVQLAELENLELAELVRGEVEQEDDSFALGELAPGEVREFDLQLRFGEPGPATARVELDAHCFGDEQRAAAARVYESQVRGVPAVRLEAIDEEDPVRVGELVTYTVRVKNQGSAEDLGVRLEATLSESLEFVKSDGDSDVTQAEGLLRFAALDQLDAGETAEWTIQARALTPGDARLELRLVSDANPSPVHEQEPTTLIE